MEIILRQNTKFIFMAFESLLNLEQIYLDFHMWTKTSLNVTPFQYAQIQNDFRRISVFTNKWSYPN